MTLSMSQARRLLVEELSEKGIAHSQVLEVMGRVPRHQFIDEANRARSYQNIALPIGYSQTISQPWVVARMMELMVTELKDIPPSRVFEVGTGSGYQTAILALLVKEVVSIERIESLHKQSKKLLETLMIDNIELRYASIHKIEEEGSFDAVIVSASMKSLPQSFHDLIRDGGVIVAPLGDSVSQKICVMHKTPNGWDTKTFEGVTFVPYLTGLS